MKRKSSLSLIFLLISLLFIIGLGGESVEKLQGYGASLFSSLWQSATRAKVYMVSTVTGDKIVESESEIPMMQSEGKREVIIAKCSFKSGTFPSTRSLKA